jgi:putative transposase
MRTRYKIIESQVPYFVTATIVEWIPVFTSKIYFEIITDSLKFCRENNKFSLHAFAILDNHLHLIVSGQAVTKGIQNFKSFTAHTIINRAREDSKIWLLNQFSYYSKRHKRMSQHQVWQEGFHPQMIQSEDMLVQKLEYIHHNPVKRGYVLKLEHWIWSSASAYKFVPTFNRDKNSLLLSFRRKEKSFHHVLKISMCLRSACA